MSETTKFQCNVPQSLKDEIARLAKDKPNGFFLKELVDVYKKSSFLLDSPDLDKACTIKNLSPEQVINEALRNYIGKVMRAEKKGLNGHIKSSKADQNIASIVSLIMEANDKAENINNVVYINQTSIAKWLRDHNIPLMNFTVIKRYLRLNKELLESHHKKYNITATHNRDVFMARRKKMSDSLNQDSK